MANDKQLQMDTRFVIARDQGEYREAALYWIKPKHSVLEVGCKDGATTALLATVNNRVIGIDHTEESIKIARDTYPNLHFKLIDGFDIAEVQKIKNTNFDVILINMAQISGYASLLDTISLLNMYASAFHPRVLIVHNKNLKSFAARCSAWDPTPKGLEAARELQTSRSTKFVGTRGVDEFRASIGAWVTENDKILEIGCEWGTTTEMIAPRAKLVIGTDVSAKCINRAKEMRPNIRFDVLDGFNVVDALAYNIDFDVIYIDISGLSGYRSLLDVISLLRAYEMILKPRAIIIKSGSLKHFASHFIAWNSGKNREGNTKAEIKPDYEL